MPEKTKPNPDTSKKTEPEPRFSFARLDFSIDLDGLIRFVVLTLVYGFVTNFALWACFDFEFTVMTMIGWGFLYYIIRYEVAEWVRSMVFKR